MARLADLFSIPIFAFRLAHPLHYPSIIFNINANRAAIGTVQPFRTDLPIARQDIPMRMTELIPVTCRNQHVIGLHGLQKTACR